MVTPVSVIVPLPLLAGLRPDGFDWQVPGLRAELITALLRALPKAIRRHVVPAADWAATLGDELTGDGPEHHRGLPALALRDALADGTIDAVATAFGQGHGRDRQSGCKSTELGKFHG